MSSTKFVLTVYQQKWLFWPLISWGIVDFFSATEERILTKLDRKQVLNIFHHVSIFLADPPTKIAILTSGWDICDFSFATAEQILTKLN